MEITATLKGMTGSWCEPETNCQRFSPHFVSERCLVLWFFGFRDDVRRFRMTGVYDGDLDLGRSATVSLFEADGGCFNGMRAAQVNEGAWGELELRFDDCRTATATLYGADGFQELALQRLAGVEGLDCF